MMLGVRCDADIFKLTARAQSIEVYDITYKKFVTHPVVLSTHFQVISDEISWVLT